MSTAVAKKTFSIKSDIASYLEVYSNKSKFVNEALSFYIDYLENVKKIKSSFLEDKIKEALDWEFYSIKLSDSKNKNYIKYENHSEKLEKELLLAVNDLKIEKS